MTWYFWHGSEQFTCQNPQVRSVSRTSAPASAMPWRSRSAWSLTDTPRHASTGPARRDGADPRAGVNADGNLDRGTCTSAPSRLGNAPNRKINAIAEDRGVVMTSNYRNFLNTAAPMPPLPATITAPLP